MVEAAVLTPLGWLASPLMKMIFDKAHDYLGTGIDKRRKILAATVLPRLSLAIDKAEKSPNKEKLVDWLKRLKGAYYEAEEAIDLFEYELLKQKVKNERGTQFVPPCLKIASVKLKDSLSVFSWQKIMLKGCIDKLIEIAKEANEFRDLLEDQENASGSDVDRETISEPPSKVFGREKDKENIVGLLTEKPLNYEPGPNTRLAISIIAIIGRSGVGKTTLAQYVYKHMDGQEHFNLHVWVHAPRKFKATDVIKNMIEIIKAKECARNDNPFTALEALLSQIRSMLGSKKLLLVLDDFWSDTEDFVEQWDNFIRCLSSCLPGSKILVTTQYKNAAQQASHASVMQVDTYNLEEIEVGQLLELFMHYAWPSNSHLQKEEFEKIGEKIVVKLKGDPGAAMVVGHQLRGKLDPRHWEEVAEKDWLGDNMKARIWSYQQLPPDLQRCFAICSLFPKGTQFHKVYLIDFWMTEGFIRPKDKQERLEDIGENYLHELVSRFFIEEVVDNEKGEIQYKLHDLFHDLAEQVQGDDFIRIDSTNSREVSSHISDMLSRSENIRHILLPASMINELKEKLCLMKNICTFFVKPDSIVPKKVLHKILKTMEKLRVLDIPDCVVDLPDLVGNLKHLRYLNIYCSQPYKKLPDSICKLYHLQKLGLPKCESLPKDFFELISLRCIVTVRETMSHISHVGRMTSLQGLDLFVVRKKRGYELHQLENLNQLRDKMRITCLENVGSTVDAVKANMQNKKHLQILHFEWNSDERDIGNVTGLSTQHVQLLDALKPHPNISSLTLKRFGGDRFPNWLLSKNSLKHLRLLALLDCTKVEEISSIDDSLPNCKVLTLRGLKNLKKMPSLPPNLTTLEINNIPQLSYFSEDDLLKNEERKQSTLEVVKQIAEYLKLKYIQLPKRVQLTVRHFLQLVKERSAAIPEICITGSQFENIFSEIVQFDPYSDDYSQDQLLDAWVMFNHYHIEIMFYKNEESKWVLPSSLSYLKISSCSIASDALSTCIQCLVSLSQLELFDILTITSLPPKEVLCSLKNLWSLTIKGCYLLSSLGGIGALTSLIVLELNGCPTLDASNESLPSSLERLEFFHCSNVDVILAESNLPVLRVLDVQDIIFKNRREVLHVGHLSCLKELRIAGWVGRLEGLNSLTTLYSLLMESSPDINTSSPMDKYAYALRDVSVDNPLLLKLMLSNETISSIEYLLIFFFHRDSSDDEVFESLTSLKCLAFCGCNNITHMPKNLKNLASIQYMQLDNCPKLCKLEELPMNLRFLEIKDCPNLCELELPMNLCELDIKDCPKLCELNELPRNLRELQIINCPTLTEKFNKGGPYRVRFQQGSTIVTLISNGRGNE